MSCSLITNLHDESYTCDTKLSSLSELQTHKGRMHSLWCCMLLSKGKLVHCFCTHTQVNGSSQADAREPEGMEAEEARETEAAEALAAQKGSVTGPADEEGLAEFSRMLSVFTHCGRLKVIAQLLRPSNQHSSSILSSIEFDRDSEVHLSFPHPT